MLTCYLNTKPKYEGALQCLLWKVRFLFILKSSSYDSSAILDIMSLNKLMNYTITVTEMLCKLANWLLQLPLWKWTMVILLNK